MSKSKLIEQSWKNSVDQVINPGDTVICISTAYRNTRVRKGIFVGTINQSPSVLIDDTRWGYWKDGKNVGYHKGSELQIKGSWEKCKRRTTLPRGRVYKLA